MMIQNTVQEDINGIVDKFGYSHEKIASDLEVSFMTVYRWSRGKSTPKSKLVKRAISIYKNSLNNN